METDLDDVPPAGVKMAKPEGDHAKILASGRWKEAVQSYLAAITFADAMIGRLIDGLDKSPYADNTIIVLWGDHGWHLGEKQHWRKFALWEEATRAPLIFVVPGVTKPAGVCARTVDFMSIYPTLTDLCGLPTPRGTLKAAASAACWKILRPRGISRRSPRTATRIMPCERRHGGIFATPMGAKSCTTKPRTRANGLIWPASRNWSR